MFQHEYVYKNATYTCGKLSYPKRVAHLQEDTAHVVATLYNNYRNDVITTTVKRQCYSVVGFDLDDI